MPLDPFGLRLENLSLQHQDLSHISLVYVYFWFPLFFSSNEWMSTAMVNNGSRSV